MKSTVIIITFCLIFVGAAFSQSNQWQGIVPLHSTRNDVEKMLGKPTNPALQLYETEREKIAVFYSRGTCKEEKSSVWNVPKETVLGIIVVPKETLPPSEFIRNSSEQFEKEREYHTPDRFFYHNKDGSIRFETKVATNGNEDITFIDYSPTSNENSRRCIKR